jgi:hypothetical protein
VRDLTAVTLTGANEIATVGLVTTEEVPVNFTVIPYGLDEAVALR